MVCKGAWRELGRGNGRGKSTHEGLRNARHEGIVTGCVDACNLRGYVPSYNLGHLDGRTAGSCACEGEGLPRSLKRICVTSGEARKGRETGGWGHPRVHRRASCAKCQDLAHERPQEEPEGAHERGAHALCNERHTSLGGQQAAEMGGGGAHAWRGVPGRHVPSVGNRHGNIAGRVGLGG